MSKSITSVSETITIKITVPKNVEVTIAGPTTSTSEQDERERAETSLTQSIRFMERHAPRREEWRVYRVLLEHIHTRLGLTARPPATGPRPYLSFYAPPLFADTARLAYLYFNRTSPTLFAVALKEIPVGLQAVAGIQRGQEGWVKMHVKNESDVDVALELLQQALRERGAAI